MTKNNKAFFIFFLTSFFLFLNACQKAPINGALDGQWYVIDVAPNQEEPVKERLYYNFSLHVCSLSYYGGYYLSANMVYDGNKLTLDFPVSHNSIGLLSLKQYGILSNPVTFNVEFEGHDRLILFNEDSTVVLIRH